MKKSFLTYLSLLIFSIVLSMLSSCTSFRDPIISGTYETFEAIEDFPFSKIKYVIENIDEETFNNSNGVDAVKDGGTSGKNQKYYNLKLYFYLTNLNEYMKVNTSYLRYQSGTGSTYFGHMSLDSENFQIEKNFTWINNNETIWDERIDGELIEFRLAFKNMLSWSERFSL